MSSNATEERFTDFKCPYCGFSASFPDTHNGTAQDCPNCLESVVVPESSSEYGGKFPIPIRTQLLILRQLKTGDEQDLRELMLDEDSFRYIDWHPLDEADIERWLEVERSARLTHSGGHLCLGVETTDSSKLIGFVSLYFTDDDHRQAGFTTMISRSFRRRGYGTEAVCGAFDFAFTGVNVRRLAVGCDSRNTAACGMLEKAGMRREGEFVKDRYVKGEWTSTVWFGLLNEEYEARREPPRKPK